MLEKNGVVSWKRRSPGDEAGGVAVIGRSWRNSLILH